MSALRTLCKALHISPFGRMEDMLTRAHSAADDAGLQIFEVQEHWFPSLQDLKELIEQVADDDARYRHNQVQLQHSAWLLPQPPGYTTDDDVPDAMTQVAAVESAQLPSMADCTPNNTVVAQTRCILADVPMHMKVPRRVVAIEIRQGTSQISRKNNFSI